MNKLKRAKDVEMSDKLPQPIKEKSRRNIVTTRVGMGDRSISLGWPLTKLPLALVFNVGYLLIHQSPLIFALL